MAPHYAKRRAKGACHFLPDNRRIRKDRLRLPSFALFLRLTGVSINAIIVLQSSPSLYQRHSRRHSKDTTHLQLPGAQLRSRAWVPVRQACIVFCQLPFSPTHCRLTFQYIEPIDAVRSLANGLVNCIDAQTAGESAAVEQAQQRSRNERIHAPGLCISIDDSVS